MPIWRAEDYDDQARLVAETFGNNTHTDYTYGEHDPHGHVPWLERIDTTDPSGRTLMDLSYTYDAGGNVVSRRGRRYWLRRAWPGKFGADRGPETCPAERAPRVRRPSATRGAFAQEHRRPRATVVHLHSGWRRTRAHNMARSKVGQVHRPPAARCSPPNPRLSPEGPRVTAVIHCEPRVLPHAVARRGEAVVREDPRRAHAVVREAERANPRRLDPRDAESTGIGAGDRDRAPAMGAPWQATSEAEALDAITTSKTNEPDGARCSLRDRRMIIDPSSAN